VSTDVERPYRGKSAEDRRAERRAALKQGCLDVLGADGVASVTIDAVCASAGLTKRYFYESFADRDALFAEVMDDFFVEVRAEILAGLTAAGPDGRERAHVIARILIEFLERDTRRARLYVEAPGQAVLRGRLNEAYGTYTELLLEAFPAAADDPDPGARRLAALLIVAGTTQAAITWLQGGIEIERERMVGKFASIIVTLLG
jgi:AcrR family transcriptional regulator